MGVAEGLVYKADLQRWGTALNEMMLLLAEWSQTPSWDQLRDRVTREDLLLKRSSHTREFIMRAFRRRFLQSHGDLPVVGMVAAAVAANIPRPAKEQIIYPYVVAADALVELVLCQVVIPRLRAEEQLQLTVDEVLGYLAGEAERYPELLEWKPYLRLRWARGFLALLRAFGLMEGAPGCRLQKLVVWPETFAFFVLWFHQQGASIHEALSRSLWKWFALAEEDKKDLLGRGQQRDYWHYLRSGIIVEWQPRFATVEEWLAHVG